MKRLLLWLAMLLLSVQFLTFAFAFGATGDLMGLALSIQSLTVLALAVGYVRLAIRMTDLEDDRQLRLDIGFSMVMGPRPEFKPPEEARPGQSN